MRGSARARLAAVPVEAGRRLRPLRRQRVARIGTRAPAVKRNPFVRALVLDLTALGVVIILLRLWRQDAVLFLAHELTLSEDMAASLVFLIMLVVCSPFVFFAVRNSAHWIALLGEGLVSSHREMSVTATRFFSHSLRLLFFLGIGVPLVALIRPAYGGTLFGFILAAACVGFFLLIWRSAGSLDREIRSGAEHFVSFLDAQRTQNTPNIDPTRFLPGMDHLVPIEITGTSKAVGMSLSELNLRAKTGALIIAIHRDHENVAIPRGSERIRRDDLLLVTGSPEAIKKAQEWIDSLNYPDDASPQQI